MRQNRHESESNSSEFQNFNQAMRTILRVDPKVVQVAVDAEIQANTAERVARGERKHGRKKNQSLTSGPVA